MDKRVFFEKVALMRDAQREYFSTRSQDALRKSKALEAEIDREIKRVRDLGYGQLKPAKQPTLFSGSDDDNKPAVPNDLYQH